MAKGFYISKALGILGILLGVAAIATIIALSVLYDQEKNQNAGYATTVAPTSPVTTITTATTLDQSKPWNRYRLPTTLLPDSYKVKLRPYLTPNENGLYIFTGTSIVRFICKAPTDVIIIHSKKLNYTTTQGHMVALRGVGAFSVPDIARTELVEPTEYLVVHLKGSLEAGRMYEMESTFQGELADDLAGFYRSEYMEGNVKKVLATTQMQSTDARKSFPCFDEPAMKATFNITLIYPNGFTALSNMPPKGPSVPFAKDPKWNVIEFETTPVMSTYLLAYIVCEFTSVETVAPNNVQVGIWARPNAIAENHGNYALNVTGPILDFFAKHFDTPYPLPKSDQVALPDFNAGAMENWGLVTYRENSLLFDPQASSSSNKERVVTVIAHELAHQWFGNLVTLAWWNDLWLNEGFASYVEYLGADYAEPTWNLKDLMVPNELYHVMAVDALASSHPLTTPAEEVNTPAQISEMFDSISYSKGASVIRMLSEFLTEDLFRKGLASYLHAFAYQNTTYLDLWEHLQMAVNNQSAVELPDTVRAIMDRWTQQMGFPVITVDTKTGSISQKHFLLDPESNVTRPSVFKYLWIVPISSIKNGNLQDHYWLQGNATAQNNMFKTGAEEWVLLNVNVTGYYQVNYDENNWRKIQNQLQIRPLTIPVINRAQVIYDSFNLASARIVPVTLALNNTLFLKSETEYMPWQAALSSLRYFKLMFDRSEVYGPMKNYLRNQVEPLFLYFENLTQNWTKRPESLMDQYNEINAISTACSNGLPKCEELAKNLYNQWMEDPQNNPIHPNLRSTIYCNAIAQGDQKEWDFAWRQLRQARLVNEADKLRSALACTNQVWLLNRYLSYTLNPDLIRKQDATSTINSIASNVLGQSLAWDFVQSNWKKIFQDYGGGSFSFSNLIQAVTRRFSTEFELQELEQFKKNNMDVGFGSGTRALEQALEKTKANIKWVKENKEVVLKWFTEHSQIVPGAYSHLAPM
ncbi:aminopeptidase N [Lagenorhynchus albirostris]|uniref:aminopeptidase N n=1 Tax=Lagenorhynchus albirostris TaxID=27610 RepID=UPI0028EFBED9|nr:aminopeptidase N [Lagenorhynchus albirostris]XP_060014754.1 aminopeptidase N [Lagenorhynchus albirostris]XP_060014764.1 aminopeptidase N [Lagenorhynchus albirostris]XP_060014774.1 aminopeptidase N [Lagenorhynchus albirostris]XP_060014784.1 aminopeptidase N [Lagenorhynchus albirostris]